MKTIIILLVFLTASASYAEDAPKPEAPAATTPTAPPAPTSVWVWQDIESSDLAVLSQCAQELPKRVADPFIAKISAHIKPVK